MALGDYLKQKRMSWAEDYATPMGLPHVVLGLLEMQEDSVEYIISL